MTVGISLTIWIWASCRF